MTSIQILALVAFVTLCGWITISDIRSRRIPNAAVGLIALAGAGIAAIDSIVATLLAALLGAGLCILIMELADFLTRRLSRHGPQLGGGDVKLAGALGLWLGWNLVPIFILCASVLFLLQNLALPRIARESPMAPALCGAAALVIFGVVSFR